MRRLFALAQVALLVAACEPDLNENECSTDQECARLKPGTVCSPENWCVKPIAEQDAAVPDPDSAVVTPDSAVVTPDSAVITPDSAVITPDSAVGTDAVVVTPDSTIDDDATIVDTDAAVDPDSAVVDPDAALPESPRFCLEACDVPADCAEGLECVDHRCQSATDFSCTGPSDNTCTALFSAWTTSCESNDGCLDGQACVDVNAAGVCATAPSEFVPCELMGMVELELTQFGSENTVIVCGNGRAACQDQLCTLVCQNDTHCSGDTPHCNLGTGRCECTDNSCTTNASLCVEGTCRCQSNDDCTTAGFDTCFDGVCGCSSVAACPAEPANPGTTVVCEPWSAP